MSAKYRIRYNKKRDCYNVQQKYKYWYNFIIPWSYTGKTYGSINGSYLERDEFDTPKDAIQGIKKMIEVDKLTLDESQRRETLKKKSNKNMIEIDEEKLKELFPEWYL